MYIEIFLPIKNYEGLYEVSALGNVRNARTKHILKQFPNNKGYLRLHLCKNGKAKWHRVHRLVAQRFIPNPLNKPEVNHKDGNKLNNCIWNLEWSTPSENNQHAYDNGLRENARKAASENAKKYFSKPVIQYTLDGKFIAEYPSAHEASRQTGINRGNISACCRGERKSAGGFEWKYI